MGSTNPAGRSEKSTEKGNQDTERMEASRRETSATRNPEQGIKDECQQEAKTKEKSERIRRNWILQKDWNKKFVKRSLRPTILAGMRNQSGEHIRHTDKEEGTHRKMYFKKAPVKSFVLTKPYSSWSETRDSPVLPTPPLFFKYVCETHSPSIPSPCSSCNLLLLYYSKEGNQLGIVHSDRWPHDNMMAHNKIKRKLSKRSLGTWTQKATLKKSHRLQSQDKSEKKPNLI